MWSPSLGTFFSHIAQVTLQGTGPDLALGFSGCRFAAEDLRFPGLCWAPRVQEQQQLDLLVARSPCPGPS